MTRFSVLFAALLAFSFDLAAGMPASAETPVPQYQPKPYAQTQVKTASVTIYALGDVHSRSASADDFAIEVGDQLRGYTAESGYEACSAICVAEQPSAAPAPQWAARLLTIQSHVSCPAVDICPDGYVSTGKDIHSHPQASRFRPNKVDKLFLRYDHGPVARNDHAESFSDADFSIADGYMVSATWLYHQSGPHDVRVVHDYGATRLNAPVTQAVVRTP